MLCAGVRSDPPTFGDVVGLDGKSVNSYGEGLCGVCGWSERISSIAVSKSRRSESKLYYDKRMLSVVNYE